MPKTAVHNRVFTETGKSDGPMYGRIFQRLRQELRQGRIQPGKSLPSERVLADRFAVSTITVRQALAALEKQGMIFRVPKVGTFAGPRPTGGVLRRQGRISVALVVPMLTTGIGPQILAGVEEACLERGVVVEVRHSQSDAGRERRQLEQLLHSQVDGAIILSFDPANIESILRLKIEGLPLVVVDHEIPGLRCDLVTADNCEGGRLAGRCLVEKHPNHFLFVSLDPMVSTTIDRYQGYLDALGETGCPEPTLVRFTGEGEWPQWPPVVDACRPVFEKLTPPIGVFCNNDYVTVGVYRTAAAMNWQVGRDLFIIGFDDDPIARAVQPTLTTIRQPAEAIGAAAAQLLLERLAGKVPADRVRKKILPVELMRRESA